MPNDDLYFTFDLGENDSIDADFDLEENNNLDANFNIYAAGTTWGSISGNIINQKDLKAALDLKADTTALDSAIDALDNKIDSVSDDLGSDISALETAIQNEATTRANKDTLLQGDINTLRNDLTSEISNRTSADSTLQDNIDNIQNTIDNYGDIVSYNASNFATAAQGLLAESALQPNDNISELNNDAGFITSADLPTIDQTFDGTSANAQSGVAIQGELTNYVPKEYLNTKIDISSSGLAIYDAENQIKGSTLVISKAEGVSLGYIDATDMSNTIANTISANANGILLQSMNTNRLSAVTLTSVNNNLAINGTEVQEKLVSGTNIKTLNNINLLGSGDITIADLTTIAQLNALNSGATTSNIGQITTNQNNIADIRSLIPLQASTSNQLADKGFVNSSIATNTANFIGTFNSVAELEAYSGPLTNNDYAFVATTDSAGNTLYDRYKYNADTQKWLFEYELNNSSFTAKQWASINSGITSGDVTLIGTALQPNDNITELVNNAGFITGITSSDVTTALGYTPYNASNPNGYTSNIGTVTSVNNIQPINGNVTLSIPTDTSDLTNGAGYITNSALIATLEHYQTVLVSGANIKTINNQSLLGSGNIDVANTTLSNVSSIDANSAVQQEFDNVYTELDEKVNTADIWYDSSTSTLYIGVAQS